MKSKLLTLAILLVTLLAVSCANPAGPPVDPPDTYATEWAAFIADTSTTTGYRALAHLIVANGLPAVDTTLAIDDMATAYPLLFDLAHKKNANAQVKYTYTPNANPNYRTYTCTVVTMPDVGNSITFQLNFVYDTDYRASEATGGPGSNSVLLVITKYGDPSTVYFTNSLTLSIESGATL